VHIAKVREQVDTISTRIIKNFHENQDGDGSGEDGREPANSDDRGAFDNLGFDSANQQSLQSQPAQTQPPLDTLPKLPRQTFEIMVFGFSEPIGVAVVCQFLLLRPNAKVKAVIEPASTFTKRPSPHPHFAVGPDRIEVFTIDALAQEGENTLDQVVRPCDGVVIVPPHSQDCVARTSALIRACVKARVKMIILLSVLTAGTKSLVGDWYAQIENNLKSIASESNISTPYTILRRGIFFDDELASASTIKANSVFYGPLGARALGTRIAIVDVAKAAGSILLNPIHHHNKTYSLCSRPFCLSDLATIWTEILRRSVTYKQVEWEQAYEAALVNGFKPWEITAFVQQLEAQQRGDTAACLPVDERGDLEAITGCRPMTIREWCESVRSMFV